MLSNDLQSLRELLQARRKTGVVLRPARIADLVAILDVAIADAEALEASYVQTVAEVTAEGIPVAELDDIPGNVASLADYRERRILERYFVPVFRTRPLPDRPDGAA